MLMAHFPPIFLPLVFIPLVKILIFSKFPSHLFFLLLFMLVLYRHLQHRNDTIIKTQEDFFNKIYIPLTLFVRVRKGYSRFACERELETEQNWNILTPTLMAVNVVSFSFSWCSTGGPGFHSAGCWLSLLYLISIFSGPQLIWASRPLWPSVAFPTTSRFTPSPTLLQLSVELKCFDFCLDWVI